MAPAQRKRCDFSRCSAGDPDEDGNSRPYVPTEGLALRTEVTADLLQHVKIAHELPLQILQALRDAHTAEAGLRKAEAEKIREERSPQDPALPAAATTPRTNPKAESIPCPTVDEGATESDWSFFEHQWDRYIKGTGLTGETVAL